MKFFNLYHWIVGIIASSFILFSMGCTQSMGCCLPSPPPTSIEETKHMSHYSIVVLFDKSVSISKHGIPEMTIEDFEPLLNLVKHNGGSFAVGAIQAFSDRPMPQLLIVDSKPISPPKPTSEAYPNDFHLYEAQRKYSEQEEAYNKQLTEWEHKMSFQLDSFKSDFQILLNAPIDAKQTDIYGAINRASIYHQAHPKAYHFTLIISDGIDDVGNKLQDTDAHVFLNYGSQEVSDKLRKLPNFKHLPTLQESVYHIQYHSKK